MAKRFFILKLIICLMILVSTSFANDNITILVNNSEIYSDVKPFVSNGTTYVPLRFISEALNTDSITWNKSVQSVTIKKGINTLNFFINKNYAFINNSRENINGIPIIKDSRTFVPLRIISETLNANVNWNDDTRTIRITTKSTATIPNTQTSTVKPSTKPSDSTSSSISTNTSNKYDADAVYWLSRIIEAEASGEPYSGKVAVGEVILNRVKSNEFPNTIWKVIFDDTYAIQFEPVANGTIYNTPMKA